MFFVNFYFLCLIIIIIFAEDETSQTGTKDEGEKGLTLKKVKMPRNLNLTFRQMIEHNLSTIRKYCNMKKLNLKSIK